MKVIVHQFDKGFRITFLQIGKIRPHVREFNLNADKKRMWFEDLKDVSDVKMIDSMPISMNYVTELK